MAPVDPRPLIAHVVYRFDTGGLENGVVNLINHMSAQSCRHAVIALTEVTSYRDRVKRPDVEFIELRKPPGHGWLVYPELYRFFASRRPEIVHTRNLAALEAVLPAWTARVPIRIHGEHGWDAADPHGCNVKYRLIRKMYRPLVSGYVAVSSELAAYLTTRIEVPQSRVTRICNGVDVTRFKPCASTRAPIDGCPFNDRSLWVVGTVGRMERVKNQTLLAHAFVRALQLAPEQSQRMRLIMVGEGPLRVEAQQILRRAGCEHLSWLPGVRDDIPDVLRGLDCFVLPSLAEGVSNTILEAMATGLPVIATGVGGNAELVDAGKTGELIPPSDVEAMAAQIVAYAGAPDRAMLAGQAGRSRVMQLFTIESMVAQYWKLYQRYLQMRRPDLKYVSA